MWKRKLCPWPALWLEESACHVWRTHDKLDLKGKDLEEMKIRGGEFPQNKREAPLLCLHADKPLPWPEDTAWSFTPDLKDTTKTCAMEPKSLQQYQHRYRTSKMKQGHFKVHKASWGTDGKAPIGLTS